MKNWAGGDMAQNWLILKNGLHVIGLFQGRCLQSEADASSSGPASLLLEDPDGNSILIGPHR